MSLETVQTDRGGQTSFSTVDVTYSRMKPKFTKIGLMEFLDEEIEQKIDSTLVHQDPVTISGNKFEVDPTLLSDNDWYEFQFKGKKIVVHKVNDTTIEIYRVR